MRERISLPTCSAKPIESFGALAMRTAMASYAAVRALPSLLVLRQVSRHSSATC